MNDDRRLQIRAQFQLWSNTVVLLGRAGDHFVSRLELSPVGDGAAVEPFAKLDAAAAQELANSLWEAGIRPAQCRQAQGEFEAQCRHLEDMRALAFSRLEIDRP